MIGKEVFSGVYLDQKRFIWQNKFFYDYVADNEQIQIFAEINTLYSFEKKSRAVQTILLELLQVFLLVIFPVKTSQFLG